jgi:hypothetical protein
MDSNISLKKKRIMLRLFPYLKNIDDINKLLIDDDSIHYISSREYADKISNIIKTHMIKLEILPNNVIISDATAGVGGDTISFSKIFKYVYAMEIDKKRSEYLKNNINIYGCTNIKIINDSCDNILFQINNHHVVFIDPPWEPNNSGSYKQFEKLTLPFCGIGLEEFCNGLNNGENMSRVPELIVLKLPKNYDIGYFYDKIIGRKIYYYDLNKMIIIVLVKI